MQINSGAEWVLRELEKAGYEAYVVGGCVRDCLMGAVPKDWDITTDARPEQVKKVFPKTFDTGIEHGTVSVWHEHETYEVTTYRIDGSYTDHRRPDAVAYTSLLYEDLARRDFTINAMAYHPERGLMDYFGGQEDLKRSCIRCVGNPKERFEEDALRMLRAVRFSVRFGFAIEPKTWEAIQKKAAGLRHVSRERVADELSQTLSCPHPEQLSQIVSAGLSPWISQEFGQGDELDFFAPGRVNSRRALRWAALLHQMGSQRAEQVLRELKFDNATRQATGHLLRYLHAALPQTGRQMRFFLHELGRDYFEDLMELMRACGGQSEEALRQAEHIFDLEKDACVTLAQLAVSGRDLIAAGASTGKELGGQLQELLTLVMERPEMNDRDTLLQVFRDRQA